MQLRPAFGYFCCKTAMNGGTVNLEKFGDFLRRGSDLR
jgi:hypothetical protein